MKRRFNNSKLLLLLLSIILISSCKKEFTNDETNITKKVKLKNVKSRGERDLPTFKEFLFSRNMLVYNTMFYEEKEGVKRSLIRYHKPSYENVSYFKYQLVQTNLDNSWKCMYLVTKDSIDKSNIKIDLFKINLIEGQVINLDKYLNGEENYIVNGIKIGQYNFNLEETISNPEREDANPMCGQEQCFDSWLVTYNVETGDILWTTYSPICNIIPCGGGGGGNPTDPIETCDRNAIYPEKEEFYNYIEQSIIPEASFHAKFLPSTSENPYFTGTSSWIVAKAANNGWSINSIFNYGYYRERGFNISNNITTVIYYYTFNLLRTISTRYYGTNYIIKSTYTNNFQRDEIFNNGTENAIGFITVSGDLLHTMKIDRKSVV